MASSRPKQPRRFIASLTALALALFGLISADEDITSTSHLCVKIAEGRFDLIHFKSITFYKDRKLVIFEGDHKLYIELELINKTSIHLNLNQFDWYADELSQSVKELVNGEQRLDKNELMAVYQIYFGDPIWLYGRPSAESLFKGYHWDRTKLAALLYTPKMIFTMDIFKDKNPTQYLSHANHHPDFAIIHDQKGTGYVINRDIYGRTNDLVIYDLYISYESLIVQIHKTSKVSNYERNSARYYFIEKSSKSNEVVLVHRSNRKKTGDPKAQLSASVPRGFRHNEYVYLMDSIIGCVYVLNMVDKLSSTFEKTGDVHIPAIAVPFEKFFQCKGVELAEPYPHDANRCKINRGVAPMAVPLNVTELPELTAEEKSAGIWVLLLILFFLILLGVGAVFGYKYYLSKSGDGQVVKVDAMPPNSPGPKLDMLKRLSKKKTSTSAATKDEAKNDEDSKWFTTKLWEKLTGKTTLTEAAAKDGAKDADNSKSFTTSKKLSKSPTTDAKVPGKNSSSDSKNTTKGGSPKRTKPSLSSPNSKSTSEDGSVTDKSDGKKLRKKKEATKKTSDTEPTTLKKEKTNSTKSDEI